MNLLLVYLCMIVRRFLRGLTGQSSAFPSRYGELRHMLQGSRNLAWVVDGGRPTNLPNAPPGFLRWNDAPCGLAHESVRRALWADQR